MQHRKIAGKLLAKRRLEKGMGLRSFAERIGYDPSQLSKVERGRIPIPSKLIITYVNALGQLNENENLELVTDTILLYAGYPPTNLDFEMAEALGVVSSTLRRFRHSSER